MKLILTKKEVLAYKEVLVGISDTLKYDGLEALNELKDSLSGNNIVKYKVFPGGNVVVSIKEDYLVEFMGVYGKYANILVSQGLTMYQTLLALQLDIDNVITKHM